MSDIEDYSKNIDLYIEKRNENDTFETNQGLRIISADNGRSLGEIVIDERHINAIGVTHGGLLSTIADTVGGVSLYSIKKQALTTSSLDIRFLNPAIIGSRLKVEGKVLKAGKSLGISYVEIWNDDLLIATATATYYFLKAGGRNGQG